MTEALKPFPKSLKITRFVFWLGLLLGTLVLVIGLLGILTGTALSVLGSDTSNLSIFLRLFGYGLVETLVCGKLILLLRHTAPSTPTHIVAWVWWFTVLQVVLSVVRLLGVDNLSEVYLHFVKEWLALALFFFYIASQFRFNDAVVAYFGAVAPPSRVDSMNRYGRKLIQLIGRT